MQNYEYNSVFKKKFIHIMSYNVPLKYKEKNKEKMPRHVAIIMDGNRRWANQRGKICILGHKAGFKAVKKAVKFSIKNNLKILTLYAFSRENWHRPFLEVQSLMNLFIFALESQIENLKDFNIRLKIIGNIEFFDKKLKNCIIQSEKITEKNNGLLLNIAMNYSGRWDILQSVKKLLNEVQKGFLKIEDIQESTFSQFLSTSSLFPVDLVIRTGGEKRISNFLLWQIAYSELYFTDVLWPDFNEDVFQSAINYFMSRERRFGGFKKYEK